jgi:Cdc6-like AAA superfamily ATPase
MNNIYNIPSTSPPRIFYKPNPSALFQGRKAELERLKDYFKPRGKGEPLSRRSILLYGMGGIGKTQISLKFTEEVAHQ